MATKRKYVAPTAQVITFQSHTVIMTSAEKTWDPQWSCDEDCELWHNCLDRKWLKRCPDKRLKD